MRNIRNNSILIVDDHINLRIALRMMLEAEGARVWEAGSVEDALTNLGKPYQWRVVICDFCLPDGNGLQILEVMAERQEASRVIMISGEDFMTAARESYSGQAFDFIEKPFDPEVLLASVSKLIEFNKIQ